jgi:uncharacterized protein (DUF1684 family)
VARRTREGSRESPWFLGSDWTALVDRRATRFNDVPGQWSTSEAGVRVVLASDESLIVEGVSVNGAHDFGAIDESKSAMAAFDDAVVEVAKRGGREVIRPRHPDHELVRNYRGTPTFSPDMQWRVNGRFNAFDSPKSVTVDSAIENLQHVYEAPRYVEFELLGASHRLTVFAESGSNKFDILFRDATSGVTTYGATRELTIDAPDAQGLVIIDFNRATNLPCAYTDFATCPLPPVENRLSIAVEAGEKIPYERLGAYTPTLRHLLDLLPTCILPTALSRRSTYRKKIARALASSQQSP